MRARWMDELHGLPGSGVENLEFDGVIRSGEEKLLLLQQLETRTVKAVL